MWLLVSAEPFRSAPSGPFQLYFDLKQLENQSLQELQQERKFAFQVFVAISIELKKIKHQHFAILRKCKIFTQI